MFCPNCGAKIENEKARFCPECGEELGKEPQQAHSGSKEFQQTYGTVQQPSQADHGTAQPMSPPRAPRKPMSRAQKILAAECALLLGSCVLFYMQDKVLNDPDKVVERYIDAWIDQDYQNAYSYLNLEESPFLSEAVFQNLYMKSPTWFTGVRDCRILERPEDGYDEEDFFTKIYRLESTTPAPYASDPTEVKVKRSFFFSDWKISPSLAQDVEIVSVPGASVRLDQIELSEANAKVESDGTYLIPEMFYGTHTVEVSLPGCVPYSETIVVSGNDVVELPPPHLTEETMKSLSEQVGQDWSAVISAAVNDTPAEPFHESTIEHAWQELVDGELNAHVISVDIGSIAVELRDVRCSSAGIAVRLDARSDLVVERDYRDETVIDGDPAIVIYSAVTEIGQWVLNETYFLENGAWRPRGDCRIGRWDSLSNYYDVRDDIKIVKKADQSGRNDPQSTEQEIKHQI